MNFFQLTGDDYKDENEVGVWPCNVPAVNVFISIATQWLVSSGGAYGLNYQTLWQKLDRLKIFGEEADKLEDDIRVLEDAALEEMRRDD